MRLFRQKQARKPGRKIAPSISATIQNNPSLAGGSAALLVVMGLVTMNAVWFQSGKHPSPIFSTGILDRSSGADNGNLFSGITPKKKPADPAHATTSSVELTKEIQAALVIKGLYSGKVDGLIGSKTRAAIAAYQQEVGLSVDGRTSPKLLSHILLSEKAVEHIPVPKSDIVLHSDEPHSGNGLSRKNLVSSIQTGLRNYGYEDIVVDGVMGNQTSTAIRRFELDYGLKVTGKASKVLLEKLADIGVIELG